MLQDIRDRAHGWLAWLIVGLISIPFALWGLNEYLAPSGNVVVATVNGEDMQQREFRDYYQQQLQNLRASIGGQIDLSLFEERLKQDTLNRLVEEELLTQTAIDQNMRVGDVLLAARIHEIPAFHENGGFSETLYRQALQMQNIPPSMFEQDMRRGLLTEQLRAGIVQSAFIAPAQQDAHVRLSEQERLLSYLLIPASRFTETVSLEEAEIEKYFAEHSKDFFTPEKISIEYIELSQHNVQNAAPDAPDEETLRRRYEEQKANYTTAPEWHAAHILLTPGDDPAAAKQQAEALLARLKAGENFEALAKEFSADPLSAAQGGDLGTFGPGRMVKPFEDALVTLSPGDLSELVQTQFGYHIIKLLAAKPAIVRSFEDVREELAQAYQREQSESKFYSKQEDFANLAFENPDNLDELARSLGLEKKSTGLFDRNGIAEGVLANPKVVEAAFSPQVLQEHHNSEALDLGEQHILVLRLKEHQASQAQALTEVKEQIISRLKQEKAQEAAAQLGKTLIDALRAGKANQQELAAQHDLNWTIPRWVKRRDDSGFEQPALAQAAFRLGQPATETALYQGMALPDGGYALLAVLGVKDGSAPADVENKEKNEQNTALGETEFRQLLEQLKVRSDIRIYTDKL